MSVIIYAFVAGALTSNSGDYINIENVFAAYVEYYQNINSHIIAEFTSDAKFSEVIELARANPDKQYKFIFVARHGASLISAITNIPSNVEIIWTGHHLNEGWRNLRIDTCYLPSHVASPYLSGGQSLPYRIVPLPGVPVFELESNSIANGSNGAADDGLLSSFDTHRKDLIWMLSGDASASLAGADDLASSWLLLTPEYADKVVHALQSNDFFDDVESVSLVNGPRTGKMQKITSTTDLSLFSDPKVQETLYHSKPFDPENNIDPITLAAKQALLRLDQLTSDTIEIGHYWREQVPGDSVFVNHSVYGEKMDIFLSSPHALLLVPGESATDVSKMISSTYCIENRHRIFVIFTDTMTDDVQHWVLSLYEKGYFGCIDARASTAEGVFFPVKEGATPPKVNIQNAVLDYLQQSVSHSDALGIR